MTEVLSESQQPTRLTIGKEGNSAEVVFVKPGRETTASVIYFPGLPGDTMQEFITVMSGTDMGFQVIGILHSGLLYKKGREQFSAGVSFVENEVINGKTDSVYGEKIGLVGVLPRDWVEEAKRVITYIYLQGYPVNIVGHSFGGIFALTALAELLEKGKINSTCPVLKIITISSPTYYMSSLPDSNMASIETFSGIRAFLRDNFLFKVNEDKALFTAQLLEILEQLEQKLKTIGGTNIQVTAVSSPQDQWVSNKASLDLQLMLGRLITNVEMYSPLSLGVNIHSDMRVWCDYLKSYFK